MNHPRPRSSLEWILITLVLLAAAVLRFHDLGNIPKGLEHDEVTTWHMVDSLLNGDLVLYFEEGYGHEPLFNYLTALPMSLLGHNWLGERFWAPWFGLLAVAATYALMRRMFGPLIGLCAAGFQATVLWALFFNRLGLRLNQLPFLFCMTVYCFWRGMEAAGPANWMLRDCRLGTSGPGGTGTGKGLLDPRWRWFAAAGALLGLCFYTYMSARVVPMILGAFAFYLIAHERWFSREISAPRPTWRQIWRAQWPVLICFVVAALVMTPLALYLANRAPETGIPQRESQVDMPLRELLHGNPKPVLENAWGLLRMWNVDGERYWQLNYSHRPVFVEPISGVLFWVGALVALWRWREPRMALLLIWVALGMVPSLLTSEAPSWPRTVLASPAALALPGIAVAAAIEWMDEHVTRRLVDLRLRSFLRNALIVLVGLSLLLTFAFTYRDFMIVWPRHPRVRYAFQSSMTEAFRYLDVTEDATPAVMSGLSPHDMDPWTQRCTLRRRDLTIRWIDTRSALIVPRDDAVRLVVLDITPVDPVLSDWAGLTSNAVLAQGPEVPRSGIEDDSNAPVYYAPAYTVYRLDTAAIRRRVGAAHTVVYVDADPLNPISLADLPQFGGLVRFVGYEWLTDPQPGTPARLLTYWTALGTGPSSTRYGEPALRIFVHLVDGEHDVAAGIDVLGAAPDAWQAGDLIVQLHDFEWPRAAGDYGVELGWYVPPDGPRLAIDGVNAPGQRVLLPPVEVGG